MVVGACSKNSEVRVLQFWCCWYIASRRSIQESWLVCPSYRSRRSVLLWWVRTAIMLLSWIECLHPFRLDAWELCLIPNCLATQSLKMSSPFQFQAWRSGTVFTVQYQTIWQTCHSNRTIFRLWRMGICVCTSMADYSTQGYWGYSILPDGIRYANPIVHIG
jgi:hypothetical protein